MTQPTWRDLPKGKYLMPAVGGVEPYREVGWTYLIRSVPRVTKAGRTIGRHAAIAGFKLAPGITRAQAERELGFDLHLATAGDVEIFASDPNYFRALYGKHEGNCGVCGRGLTDAASRDRGIGPDCAAELGIA